MRTKAIQNQPVLILKRPTLVGKLKQDFTTPNPAMCWVWGNVRAPVVFVRVERST